MDDLSRRRMMGLAAAGLAGACAESALAAGAARDRQPLPGTLRTRIAALLKRNQMPAVAVAAVKRGRPVIVDALGLASLPFAAPATERTLFHWGSASKQLTAALVVRLALAGKVGLDQPLGRYVQGLPEQFAGLPIHTLLSHTSGAPDYALLGGQPDLAPDRHIDRATFLAKAGGLQPDFKPGEAWSYSNTGYVLLGYLAADLYGESYRDAVTRELLKPARLAEGRMDDAPAVIAGRAEPYDLEGGVLRHAMMMDGEFSAWPDGGALMSARDAARWETGLQSNAVISAEALRLMTTPERMVTGRSAAYGFGWFLDRVHGRVVHYHGGSVPGFLTFYVRVPSEGIGVVAMTNVGSDAGGRGVQQIAQELVEHLLPGSTWLSLAPVSDPDPARTAEARAMLTRGKAPLDPARFASEIAPIIGRPAGRRAAPPNLARLGAMKDFQLVETFDEGGCTVRRYRAVYDGQTEHVTFGHAPDGHIFRARAL